VSGPTPPRGDDGDWTSDYVSANGKAGGRPRDPGADRLLALGYITAIAIPPVGLVIGIIIAIRFGRPYSTHVGWIVGLSVVAAVVWVLILSSNVIDTSTNDLS
jgi:hypothetical protein